MVKKIILAIFTLGFIYVSVELFKYFSYWGLGFSAILLATVFSSVIIAGILSWIIKNRKKIYAVLKWLAQATIKTRLYQKIINKLQSRWPRLYEFSKKRLAINSPTGIYTTIGTVVAGIFLFLFLGVSLDLLLKAPLYSADLSTINLLRAFISSSYISFFVLTTTLGNTSSILIAFFAATLILLLYRNYRTAQYLAVCVGAGGLFYWLIKWLAHRPRPQGISYIVLPQSFSFPSGHAVMAVCLYGFIAYLLFKVFNKAAKKAVTIVAFLLLSLAIGVSRVYLGVHYPTDVIAGWYLGLTVLIGSITAYEVRNKFYPPQKPIRKQTLLTSIISLALIAIPLAAIYQSFRHTEITTPSRQSITTTIYNFVKNAPRYSENLLGQTMEPLSFIVIGDRQSIINIFTKANWQQAEQPGLASALKELSAIAKNTTYPSGPMTPAFYNQQANDLGFEKAVSSDATARQRHHTRYWQTGYQIDGKPLWVATASLDEGIEIGSTIKLPTHKINPNIDTEREYIFQAFLTTGQIKNYQKVELVGPTTGTNASGDKFFTDGKAYIVELK